MRLVVTKGTVAHAISHALSHDVPPDGALLLVQVLLCVSLQTLQHEDRAVQGASTGLERNQQVSIQCMTPAPLSRPSPAQLLLSYIFRLSESQPGISSYPNLLPPNSILN